MRDLVTALQDATAAAIADCAPSTEAEPKRVRLLTIRRAVNVNTPLDVRS